MQLSSIPAKIAAIFAASAPTGYKNTIPLTQAGISQPGQASFDVGFPSVTMQPASAGGINPYGQDFNGLAYALTGPLQWLCAGGTFPFDSAFATSVGGYPKGAILQNANGDGYWLNLADNNTANPDTGGANWVPLDGYGVAAVTGLTNSNVTLTPAQYAKRAITLAGTLTGNVQIIFPTLQQQWLVVNNTTGSFTVTCKTASGTGSAVPQGGLQAFWGDGTNLNQGAGDARYQLAGATSQAAIQGASKNLVVSTTGTSAPVTVTADEITVESAANAYQTLRAVSVTPSLAASGANGLDTGTSAANTWYSVWVIWNGTTTAGLLSLSSTAPTMPSGYTYKARVGWVRSDGTANKYPLRTIQYGRGVDYIPATGTNVTILPSPASGAAGTYLGTPVSVAWANYAPPTAVRLKVQLYTGPGIGAQVTSGPIVTGGSGFQGISSNINVTPGTVVQMANIPIESSNIYYASQGAAAALYIAGWEDNL